MSFADATYIEPANASGGAVGADKNLIPDGVEAKKLMAANDANVAAAEQALALYKRTPTDHWWATIENFTKKALLRKLDEAKQKRDNAFWTIHDTSLFRFDSEHFSYVD